MNEIISREVSRRDFLKAAAGAGVVAAGSTMLPLSGYAAEEDKAEAASRFTAEQLELIGQPHPYSAVSYEPIEGTDPIPPLTVPDQWDYECDVVVVGCGGGGLNASVRCAEAGLSVIAIDKLEEVGGCTKESSCFMCYGGSRVQNEAGFAIPEFPYNPEALVQMQLAGDPGTDLVLARKYAAKMPETVDWMADHGVPWEMTPDFHSLAPMFLSWEGSVRGGFFPRATKLITDHMKAVGEQAGTQYFLKTQVVGLVKDGDAVVGVKTVNIDGQEEFFHAKAGVILTAGGFASNPQMLQKYCPTAYRAAAASKLPPCDTGEVIRMALGAGADLAGFDKWGAFDGGIDAYAEGLSPFSHYLYSGDNQLSRQPWLTIDKAGARQAYFPFIPDGYHTHGIYTQFGGMTLPTLQAAKQGGRLYIIFDADYETHIVTLDQKGCRTPITPDMPNVERLPAWLGPHDWRHGVARSLEKGIIKQADTIEDLAELLGLNQDILVNAVQNWNEICETGEDPEYEYESHWLIPIVKPPFYGMRIGIQMGQTMCGAHINGDFQAIDTNGLPIKGLYCGTHTAGATPSGANGGSWTGGYCAAEGLLKSVQGSV